MQSIIMLNESTTIMFEDDNIYKIYFSCIGNDLNEKKTTYEKVINAIKLFDLSKKQQIIPFYNDMHTAIISCENGPFILSIFTNNDKSIDIFL